MTIYHLSSVINKGIDYLSSVQENDGSFISFSSNKEHNFGKAFSQRTIFLNACILAILSSLPLNKRTILIKNKLAHFLLNQKSDHWSWNYWVKGSQEEKDYPYPDDLDDTFCALVALLQYDKKIITGEAMANIVKLLIATEVKEGGPYRTWLVHKDSSSEWKDIDFAVNSNVAYFLSLKEITLLNLQKFFETKIKEKKLTSRYYPSVYVPLYFLSRFYIGTQRQIIAEVILKKKKGSWENPLNTALAILILLNFDFPTEKLTASITYLLQTQKNGKWDAYGFCMDPSRKGEKYFAGSPALTTVFCLEALQKYQSMKKIKNNTIDREKRNKGKEFFNNAILKKVNEYLSSQKRLQNDKSKILLQKLLTGDTTQQIPLIAYYFFESLTPRNKKITKKMIVNLGAANILGWMAYTIYDDFFDEEGDPSCLSLANYSLRTITSIFDTFSPKRKKIQENFHAIMDKVDQANFWEINNCRIKKGWQKAEFALPEYKKFEQLAYKSIGHALGPLTILIVLGYTKESREFKEITLFFTHYLIAKQLNDDAHDFQEDLKKGHVTPVVALLLKRIKEKKSGLNAKKIQELFWEDVIEDVCAIIKQNVKKARVLLKKSEIITNPTFLEGLLVESERAADRALEEKRNVTAFLKTYKAK